MHEHLAPNGAIELGRSRFYKHRAPLEHNLRILTKALLLRQPGTNFRPKFLRS